MDKLPAESLIHPDTARRHFPEICKAEGLEYMGPNWGKDPFGIELGLENYRERALIRSVAMGWANAYRRMRLDALAGANSPKDWRSSGIKEGDLVRNWKGETCLVTWESNGHYSYKVTQSPQDRSESQEPQPHP